MSSRIDLSGTIFKSDFSKLMKTMETSMEKSTNLSLNILVVSKKKESDFFESQDVSNNYCASKLFEFDMVSSRSVLHDR